uniref:Uncharacterized protein n=1 Tax=Magallana gigas TaxID=29159 RepID=A0A8W8P3L6_MAGGI
MHTYVFCFIHSLKWNPGKGSTPKDHLHHPRHPKLGRYQSHPRGRLQPGLWHTHHRGCLRGGGGRYNLRSAKRPRTE